MKKHGDYIGTWPSLYSAEATVTDSRHAISILEALEPARARGSRVKWAVAGIVLLLTTSMIYLLMADAAFPGRASVAALIDAVFKQERTAVAHAAPDTIQVATEQLPEAPRTATIITEEEKPNRDALMYAKAVTKESTQLANSVTGLANDVPKQFTISASSPEPEEIKKASSRSSMELSSARKFELKSAEKAARSLASAGTNNESRSKDKDVDLIAALLAYTPRPSGSGKSTSQKSPIMQNERLADADTVVMKRVKRDDPKRDIVTRTASESTESLVKRCQALGFFEGELCRLRICSGHWGSDPACPSSNQASNN
jgi:hypothetical protein